VKWYLGKLAARYRDRVDVNANVQANVSANVTALQFQVILEQQVLVPVRLERLDDEELTAWQAAIATLPKLMAPLSEGETRTLEPTEVKFDGKPTKQR
jgi:hypothetical protein